MFIMVGEGDSPIYEAEFLNVPRVRTMGLKWKSPDFICSLACPQREDTSHLNQFIIHAALDMVDDSVWGTQSMYLKCVHKFNGNASHSLLTCAP